MSDVGKGYRAIEDGEVLQQGDEWRLAGSSVWRPVLLIGTVARGRVHPYRRPIPVQQHQGAFRDLAEGEILQPGDEFFHPNGNWYPTKVPGFALSASEEFPYRRPIPVQQQTQFLDHKAAVSPETTLESDRLRAVLSKESEHREIVDVNNEGRDRAVDVGRELELLRVNFARSFPDRLFIVGNRVVSTDDGFYDARSAEVVS